MVGNLLKRCMLAVAVGSIASMLIIAPAITQAASAPVGDTSEAAESNQIRPFRVRIPQAAIDDLRQRVLSTRWPDKETVADSSQIYRAPQSWTRAAYPSLVYFHEVDRGGHFAAWEQPGIFAQEMRAAFKPFR